MLNNKSAQYKPDEDLVFQFMLKKLELEYHKQASTRTLGEQVMTWYIGVLVFVITVLGFIWSNNKDTKVSIVLTAMSITAIGLIGILVSMRILRFMIDYDILQKLIDKMEVYFIINNISAKKYIEHPEIVSRYRATNPLNITFFYIFSLVNSIFLSLGISFFGYFILDILIDKNILSITNRIDLWIILAMLLFLIALIFNFLIQTKYRRKLTHSRTKLTKKEMPHE